jgi:hypothetical protein
LVTKEKSHSIPAICLIIFSLLVPVPTKGSIPAPANIVTSARRVNVPYWPPGEPEPSRSIFWFGRVDLTNNYSDVRAIYDNNELWVTVHIIDRLLRTDTSPDLSDITNWDAISLYLDLDGNIGDIPDSNAYLFTLQLSDFHASYRGNGSSWAVQSIPFDILVGWRGDGGINDDLWDKGWVGDFHIPFKSLGLSGAPSPNSKWGIGVITHDRDEVGNPALHQVWPESMDPNVPSTWGEMNFGVPHYISPANTLPEENITIRQGLNGALVKDGEVGGHTTCGAPYGPGYFEGWGNANYAGYDQINIQNQWDIADWPCFSKFFVTFPLATLPPGMVIVSATLTMHLFGNSGGGAWGDPPDSYIQVLTVNDDWDENTLTWNNAPLAKENISGTWVKPMTGGNIWPGDPYQLDVGRAVADAYATGKPLRLALYSADGAYHTGKYFSSSDTGDWNAVARPTLNVVLGKACSSPGITCFFTYLPNVNR